MKYLHIINIRCDRYTKKYDITNLSELEIKEMIDKFYIKGVNFPKIIEL